MALAYTNEVELNSTSRPDGTVQRVVACTATFDSSYPTGGEVVTPADIAPAEGALSEVDFVVVASQDIGGQARVQWDRDNEKLLIFIDDGTSGVPAQAGSTSDQSGVIVELLVYGR